MTMSAEIRRDLVRALRLDLVGPGREDDDLAREVLPQAPSRWYLTGFLVPYEAPAAAAHHPTHRKRDRLSRPGGRVYLSARLLRRAAQSDACRAPLRDGNRACERSRTHLPQEGLATKRCLSYLREPQAVAAVLVAPSRGHGAPGVTRVGAAHHRRRDPLAAVHRPVWSKAHGIATARAHSAAEMESSTGYGTGAARGASR